MMYEFEKRILDKIDQWQPTAVNKDKLLITQRGFGENPKNTLRLIVSFIYDTTDSEAGDRASIGDTFLQRTPCEVHFDLYAGNNVLDRKTFLNLFSELRTYCLKNMNYDVGDVTSDYEDNEALISLILTFRLDKEVSR